MAIGFGGSSSVTGGTGTTITLNGHAQVVGTVNLFVVQSPNNFTHVWPEASGYIKLGQQHSGASFTVSWGYVVSNGTSAPTGAVTVASVSTAIPSGMRFALSGSISLVTPFRLVSTNSGSTTTISSATYNTTRTNSKDIYLVGRLSGSTTTPPSGYTEWTDGSLHTGGMTDTAIPGSGDSVAALSLASSIAVDWSLARIEVFEDFPALPRIITGISTAVAPAGPFKAKTRLGQSDSSAGLLVAQSALTSDSYAAQVFTPRENVTLSTVSLRIYKTGAPSLTLTVELRATDPTGALLATLGTILPASLGTVAGVTTVVTLGTPYNLVAGTVYCLKVGVSGVGNNTNYYTVQRSTADSYPDGISWNGYSGSSTPNATSDLYFEFNGGLAATDASPEAYYFFGCDASNNTTLRTYKTTDPTLSWASAGTGTGLNTATTLNTIAGYQVGNIIHLLLGSAAGVTSYIQYVQYDTATDTIGTPETVLNGVTTAGQTGSQQSGCSLVVRSTGEVVAFYNGLQTNTSGTPRARLYYSRRTGVNTWAAAVRVDPNTASDNISPDCVLGASDRVHFYWNLASTGQVQRSISSANVLDTQLALGVAGVQRGASFVSGANTQLVLSGSAYASYGISAASTALTTGTLDGTATISRIFIDGTTIWYLYRSSNDSDLYVRSSTNLGVSFGAASLAFTGTVTVDANLSLDSDRVYQRGYSVVIPYIVNDNGTLKYNEYTVRTITADAWNSGDKSASVTLSNSDKTAAGASLGGVRSTTVYADTSSDKFYAEFRYDSLTGGTAIYPMLGIASTAASLTSGTAIVRPDGNVFINGVQQGTALLGAAAAGDVISIAWDVGADRVWLRRNAGSWNGSGAADPATNTGGFDVAYFSGNYALWTAFQSAGPIVTIRTEVADFTQTTPSGFLSWMGETLGPAGYTLTALTGTVTLAGQNLKLARTHDLNITAGAVALTGQNVTLTKSVPTLTALPGAFNLAGQSVTLRVARRMPVTAGARLLNSQNVTLRYGHKSQAGTGTFALAGQTVTLRAIRKMPVTAGAVVLSGQNVTLTYTPVTTTNYVMSVLPGAVTLAGQSVNLLLGRRLTVTTGAVALAGQPVTLRYGHKMQAGLGAFALTGQPVTLRYAHKTQAGAGAVVLSGKNVNLAYSGAGYLMSVQTGTFALAGQSVTLRYTRKMVVTKGTFTLAGQNITLRYSHKLVASSGAVVLSGKNVNLVYTTKTQYTMSVLPGAIALSGQSVTLRCARKLAALPGGIVLAGEPILLRRGRTMTAGVGAITLAGAPLVYHATYIMSASSAQIRLTSVPVYVNYFKKLTEQPGRLVFGRPGFKYIPNRW